MKEVEKLTAPAPTESNIAREHEYTDLIHLICDDKAVKYSDSVASLVSPYLENCGRYDLVSITAVYVCPVDKGLQMGFCSTGQSLTAKQVGMKRNGLYHVGSAANAGTRHVVTLVPEDTLSTQLQPVSAQLPSVKLILSKDISVALSLEIAVKVHGIRQRYGNLN